MAIVTVETAIAASAAKCFDAARDMDLHVRSVDHTGEQAVAGRTSGLIKPGETVTFRARHFEVVQHFTSQVTAFERPRFFQDRMLKGAFQSFQHDHFFAEAEGGTSMVDVLEFRSPLGLLGRIVDRVFLAAYLRRLLHTRAATIKQAAESMSY